VLSSGASVSGGETGSVLVGSIASRGCLNSHFHFETLPPNGWMHCRCRAGSTTIAVAKSGAEGGGSEQCLRTRLRGSKRGSSEGQKRAVGDSADPAGAALVALVGNPLCLGQEEQYNARDRGQIRNSSLVECVSGRHEIALGGR
jgi:hypothetical protein